MKTSVLLCAATIVLFVPAVSVCQERAAPEKRAEREAPARAADKNRVESDRAERRDRPAMAARTAASELASVMGATSAVRSMSKRIQFLNPNVSNEMLSRDEPVVYEVLLKVKTQFAQEGLDEADAEGATFSAWLSLRIGGPSRDVQVALTVEVLGNRIDSLGKLIIGSDPTDAQVDIKAADQSYTERTEAKMWLSAGTYRVRLSKPGYSPLEEDVEVKSRKKTEFKKTLTAQ